MKSKTTAALLAIFLGGFGVHKFYLNQIGTGVAYLIFCWTLVPILIGFFQGINLLSMSQEQFDRQYN